MHKELRRLKRLEKNKKGQALSMQTIIIIILAILVLIIIALNFTVGLQTAWGRIVSIFRGTSGLEVQNAIAICNGHVSPFENKYLFCCKDYEVVGYGNITCDTLGKRVNWQGFEDSEKVRDWCAAYLAEHPCAEGG